MNSENEKILNIFRETGALMEGHFILRSGLHSGHFFQCARVCEHLDRVTELVEMLVKKLGDIECDTVIAPALGGLVLGQEVARQLKKRFIFAEKENGKDATLTGLAAKEIKFKYKDNFEKLFDLYINNSITKPTLLGSKSVADSMAEFALGKVAMIQNGNWAWSQISGVSGNTVKRDDIKMLPLYTGIDGEEKQGICIGTENYLAINKKVSKKLQDQSLDFLYWLFSSDTGKRYVTEKLNFITPFTTFSQDEQPDDPLAKEIVRYMNDDSLNTVPWIFTSFPSEAYKKEVGSALLDYVQGDKKWEDVEKSITEKWKSERA